jgi:hypothetical protein
VYGDRAATAFHASPYTSTPNADNAVDFAPVTTKCLRAMFDASTDGSTYAAVALQEWQVFSTRPRRPRRTTKKETAASNCA